MFGSPPGTPYDQGVADDEARATLAIDEALIEKLEHGDLCPFWDYATLMDSLPASRRTHASLDTDFP